MADGMIVPATTIYFGTAALLLLSGLAIAGLALRKGEAVRRLCLASAVPALVMVVSYVSMGMEWATVTTAGREQSVMRFVGYTLAIAAFVYVVRDLIGLTRRASLGLTAVLLLQPWFSLAGWIVGEPLASLFSLGALVGTVVGAYALFVPVTRRAREASGEARLLYAKLRNLFVLCTGLLVVQAVISEQSLGLTNLFVGQLAASYTDLILTLGIGGLVLSGANTDESDTAADDAERASAEDRQTLTSPATTAGDE